MENLNKDYENLIQSIDNSSKGLGDWAISIELIRYILQIIPIGAPILVLGDGDGTKELSKFYEVNCIENDPRYVSKDYNTILAPIKVYENYKWYDIQIVKDFLTKIKYSFILLDGPLGTIGREGFMFNSHLFDMTVPIAIDDTHRNKEIWLAEIIYDMFPYTEMLQIPSKLKNATVLK